MKTLGIIVEYNPLHNGHAYHFEQSRIATGADAVVAVMSGPFLQRGEPAIVSKWARAEMALHLGADLVLELPVAFSCQPAEWFAYGAVSALDATGVVDSLCFGSESGDIGWLRRLAGRLHAPDESFRSLLRERLKRGGSYPAAYAAAVAAYAGDDAHAEALAQPNNTLGLHYLIALERLNSPIRPYTIPRVKAAHNQADITDARIASATAIRGLLAGGLGPDEVRNYVPSFTSDILRREWELGRAPVRWNDFFRPLLTRLLACGPEELARIHEIREGLEHRIKKVLPSLHPEQPDPFGQLVNLLKTKRYTRTKLQRALLRILLHHTKDDLSVERLKQGVPYLRVLGFSGRGRELLKRMKRTAKVPVVTKVTAADSPFLELDLRAAALYATAYRTPAPEELFRDYYQAPLRL